MEPFVDFTESYHVVCITFAPFAGFYSDLANLSRGIQENGVDS